MSTYIEPITWQVVEKIIAKERPDAVLPTMGGQTALNCALDLHKHGVLEKYGVEMIGANEKAIEKAEDRLKFKDAMTGIGLRLGQERASRTRWKRRWRCRSASPPRSAAPASRWSSGRASRSAAPAAASPTTRTSSRRSASAASTSRRPRSC